MPVLAILSAAVAVVVWVWVFYLLRANRAPQPASSTNPARSTTDEVASTATAPPLQVPAWNCLSDPEVKYVEVRGEVRNLSVAAIDDIDAVATFRTSDGTFVKSADTLIEYQPLMAGQTSPFHILATINPVIQTAELSFKELSGGSIAFIGTNTLSCPPGDVR
jgi:hypothetical protein